MYFESEEIRELAATLARDLHQKYGSITLPIPVEEYAKNLGARIEIGHAKTDGWVKRGSSGYVVGVSDKASKPRQRFTIAHEIGHILVDQLTERQPSLQFRYTTEEHGKKFEERFCNWFANYLLIPDRAVHDLSDWA